MKGIIELKPPTTPQRAGYFNLKLGEKRHAAIKEAAWQTRSESITAWILAAIDEKLSSDGEGKSNG